MGRKCVELYDPIYISTCAHEEIYKKINTYIPIHVHTKVVCVKII